MWMFANLKENVLLNPYEVGQFLIPSQVAQTVFITFYYGCKVDFQKRFHKNIRMFLKHFILVVRVL